MFGVHVGPVAEAPADGDVVVVAPEVDGREARANVEIDVRMRREEPADPRQQPAGGERRHDADAQLARIGARGDLVDCGGQLRECGAHAGREALTFVGQANPAARALDEPHAEIALQRLDLMTDRAVREAERFRGLGEATRARRGIERPQRLHRRQAQAHRGRP